MDRIKRHFKNLPSQEQVATLMLKLGMSVHDGGAYCGPVLQSDTAVARAIDVDRRVVRSTINHIMEVPELLNLFSRVESMLLLANAASEDITPADEQRARRQNSQNPELKQQDSEELPPEARIFRFRERQQYYVVIIVDDRRVQATELQYRLSDFNTKYYSNSGYKVNASLFTDTTQLITVHRFVDDQEALKYYRHLGSDESPLANLSANDYTLFFISTQNYATLYNRKNIPAYLAYFRKYHLNNN